MSVATRFAILSDIHGNATALKAVIAKAKEFGVHEFCCLGDIIGYGASLKECVDLVRTNCTHTVQGNHDCKVTSEDNDQMRPEAVAALAYARSQISQEDIDFLCNQPHPKKVGNLFLLTHGALTGRDNYILKQTDAQDNIALLKENYPGINLMFFGHTHLPMVLTENGAKTDFTQGGVVTINPQKHYLVNPGSVGQPRDKTPQACFCIYDTQDSQVIYMRVEYDIKSEQERILAAGLPEKNARRLALGR